MSLGIEALQEDPGFVESELKSGFWIPSAHVCYLEGPPFLLAAALSPNSKQQIRFFVGFFHPFSVAAFREASATSAWSFRSNSLPPPGEHSLSPQFLSGS